MEDLELVPFWAKTPYIMLQGGNLLPKIKRKSGQFHTQIETILRERGPLTAYEIGKAMVVGRWKRIPTPYQMGNLLKRNKNIEKIGMTNRKNLSSTFSNGNGRENGVTLWALIEEGD